MAHIGVEQEQEVFDDAGKISIFQIHNSYSSKTEPMKTRSYDNRRDMK
jgi:hypothetical protein